MTTAVLDIRGVLDRVMRMWFAALFLLSSAIAFVDDVKQFQPAEVVDLKARGIGKGAWWFVPGVIADQFGAQDAIFYEFGLPTPYGWERHIFASLRAEVFWAQFGKEAAYAATPKGFAAVLALGDADPIFRRVLPSEEQMKLAAQDAAVNMSRAQAIKIARGAAAAIAFLAHIDAVQAQMHGPGGAAVPGGGGSAGVCPMGVFSNDFGTSDDCTNAPTGTVNNVTLIQRTTFFTGYAQQSGQGSYTRPAWNVPGVDYPVGIASSVIIKDPASGRLPTGCTYNGAGSGNGGPLLTGCNTENPTFNGFDFSGTLIGSHGCVLSNLSEHISTRISFKNNYFGLSSLCRGGKYNSGLNIGLYQLNPGAANWDFENNVWDYSPVITTASIVPASLSGGDWTILHNACLNISAAGCWPGSSGTGKLYARWNYIENYDFDVKTQGHGEIIAQHNPGIRPFTSYEFNTILEGAVVGCGALTSNIYVSNGNGTSEYTQAIVESNVTVENLAGGPGGCISAGSALIFFDGTHDNTTIAGNYFDKTGALPGGGGIARSNAICTGPLNWSNNINLLTGEVVRKAAGVHFTGGSGCNT